MIDYEKQMAVQDELITRRKRARATKREETGQKAGLLSERELKKLIRQAQRRKAKLVRDRARRGNKGKKKEGEE